VYGTGNNTHLIVLVLMI